MTFVIKGYVFCIEEVYFITSKGCDAVNGTVAPLTRGLGFDN